MAVWYCWVLSQAVDPQGKLLHLGTNQSEALALQTAHLSLLAAARPGVAPCVTVLLGSGPAHEDSVRSLLATLAPGARVIRVANPLRSPLTIERILIQGGQAETGLLSDDVAEGAMQRLCQRRDGESRVVLLIEQAETLGASALRILSHLVTPGGRQSLGAAAPLHVVFVGQPSFKQLVKDKAAIRNALANPAAILLPPAGMVPFPAAPAAIGALPGPMALLPPDVAPAANDPAPASVQPSDPPGFRTAQALLMLMILSALGAGAVVTLPHFLEWLGTR